MSAPSVASRAYDSERDGFVISGGGGTLVLEELDHAKARGAKIYGEITGYGATSDGYDMVQPSGEGAERCMNMAIKNIKGKVDISAEIKEYFDENGYDFSDGSEDYDDEDDWDDEDW